MNDHGWSPCVGVKAVLSLNEWDMSSIDFDGDSGHNAG